MAEASRKVADLSPGELRAFISRLKGQSRTEDAPIPRRPVQGGQLPLSFAQERLWFLDRLGEGSAPYAIPSAVRLSGVLDPAVLRRTFAELVRRHESLRTTFGERGGVPFQTVAAEADAPLPQVDLSLLPGPRREAEMLRLAGEEARRPFDLARGPLLRNLLVRLGPEDHVLAMAMHHIVSDGWSMTVLIREIAALYEALAGDGPSPLPEPQIQYADFAVWQRERLGSERMEAEVSWWRERLAGLEPLEIPSDRPRPAVQSHRGARRRLSLSGATAARLQDLARREGVTPFMALLALWSVLLFRYSGQADIAVGAPVANRNRSELEGLIGFLVNTLVLRSDLSGRPGFRELLGRVREMTLGAYAHDELPFEKLVEHLQPERLRDRNPLFQVMCTLQNQPWPELRLGAMRIAPLELDPGVAKLDLNLTWVEQAGSLEGSLEYNTDLWDGATAQRLLRHYLALVRAVLDEPERAIGDLPLLGETERRQILMDWNRTARDYPREATVHALFEERARISGDAVAVVSGEERSTYAELNARANQLARHLRRLGVGPESVVGLAVPRSPEMVAGVLGILKAGGAYLPLDPSYPKERLARMLEDARPRALVTLERLLADLPCGPVSAVCLDRDRDALRGEDQGGLPRETAADNLAYVMFTSGSTGRPKGVAVPHRAVVRLVRGSEFIRLGEEEVFLQLAPLAFDASTLEIWGPLLNGGRLALAPPGALSLPELRREIERRAVTTLWLTAGLFHQMVEEEVEGLRPLRQLLAGGEALSVPHVQRALSTLPGCALVNGYGPTENTTFTCCHRLSAGEILSGSVPIGRPIANTRVYLLDPEREPVPAGVPGELCAGGDGLARGYLGRPDLTAERFVPDPCSGEPGARLYRTGDLARFRPDGAIEFLGRIDQQVKIRGFRVEPGEVEAALLEHPAVGACVLLARQDRPGGRRLVAYVSPAGASAVELRSFLAAKLPAYMIPAAFVLLPELPLNPNGKVDRRALARLEPPAPLADTALAAAGDSVAPRTPTELRVAAIWKDLLGFERAGLGDSFFELGGHSLLAVQLVSRLRDAFGIELPLGAVFEEPTLAKLAERVEAAHRAAPVPGAPPLLPAPRGDALPLSFAQERLWFLEQLEPGSAFYNIPSATRLSGSLRVDILRRCLDEMVRRHESLRTTFEDRKGQPFQVIAPPEATTESTTESPVIDLSGLPLSLREEELRRRATGEARRPFDLARGPLFRVPLFRLSSTEHVILPNMHHIISDGWSMTIVNREMAALYEAFAAGRSSPLPELPVQYAGYSVWQRRYLQGAALEAKMAYWRERLAGVSGLQLPTDRPRPAVETFRGRQRAVGLPAELTRKLHGLALGEGVTLFMTLLAAFQALLLRYTGQTDVPVGSPVANRYRSDIEGIIGFFANTVVLRTDLSGNPSFRELLGRVREVTLGAYAHEDLPFEKLVEELQPERDMSRNPLFQVMCVLQNQPWPAFRMGDIELSPVLIDSATAKFDLTLFWRESDGVLRGVLEHNTDLFDDSTALRFYRHYEALLRAALEDPGRPAGALPLLGDAERHQILLEWNRPWTGEWAGRCVHLWVEEQVARTPEALAVIDGGRRLTYAELNARANRLAHGLRHLGVRPESLVGICVERSLEMVVAALAVLKAGGALVALDPAYPRERLATIVDDARLAVLLTQASLLQHFPQHTDIALLLERDAEPFPRESSENLVSGVDLDLDLDNPIYAIYTSGSTGQPKGILVTHRAFSNLLAWQLGDSGLRPGARTAQLSTFGFCVSFQEMFSSWCSGGGLALADEMTRRDLGGLSAFLESQRIERLHLPFAALKHLAEAAAGEARLPSSLSAVITAGEQLQVTPAVRGLFERLPGCTLSNQYGASETHVISAETLSGDPGAWPAIPPVGRPVANVRIHLLDADLQPVPAGVAGELYAAGACVARCYLNDPVLTAQKLVPDPYSPAPGSRLYRTGDSARYLTDGRIEYHGRIDTQVKIRGFRVELGEIDTVLARHPGVRDAAVVARAGREGQSLVAYIVPAGPDTAPIDELRAWLKQKLPEYMVPAAFVEMSGLPLNANGKLDQATLPEPEMQPGSRAEYVAPRMPVEELLAGMYAELLGVEKVGINDSFFELGGHSLQGTRLMAQVRDAFGVDLKVRALFESPTVAELAVAIALEMVELTDDEEMAEVFAELEQRGA
ncbi:MAG TPA: amino acid adenylation domain-containing protein [Thermoanaerobaculia bacterium]